MRNLVYSILVMIPEWAVWKLAFTLSAIGNFIRGVQEEIEYDYDEEQLAIIEEMTREKAARDRVGNIYHVSNRMRKPAADKEYFVAGLTNRVDGATDPIIFMFTDNELIRAEKRAQKNTEDIPADLSDDFYGTDNS